MKLPYRKCVVAVFIDQQNRLLVGRRKGTKNSWQFPQGGVDSGESNNEALKREVKEEIGCEQFEIIRCANKLISYDFPEDATFKIAQKYRGQEQSWFLCRLPDGYTPDLSQATDDEFDALEWRSPNDILQSVIPWKKEAYLEGYRQLNLKDLS